ncbi:MAG: hydroxyacid dehydrogenase [Calditrichaeota bacterium]|nr:hydroxyacid dehydrogenase [Calditrichota bacterium]
MMDIFFYEAFEEETEKLKKYLPGDIKCGFSWKTIQEENQVNPPSRLISIRTQSEIPVKWSSKLDAILTRSTGYDHILRFHSRSSSNVNYGYLPLYCNRAVAEQAMLLWMSLLRKLKVQVSHFRKFNRDGITGQECQGRILTVFGVGNIGSEAVKIGQGLGMTVLGVDPVEKHSFVKYVNPDTGLEKADILLCSMNLKPGNYGFFNYERLKKAKKGVIFINIARGEMSPSADLLQLLKEGHLGGLGMDVYNHEAELGVSLRSASLSDNPEIRAVLEMSAMDNVIMTPHNAFNTSEAVERKSLQSIQQIDHFLKNNSFLWPVPLEEYF